MSVGILVVVLVVLALVGSLLWLLPSASENRRMRLRQAAFAKGVRVREAREEMKEWKIDLQDAGMLMQYYLINPKAKRGRWSLTNPSPTVRFQRIPDADEMSAPLMPDGWANLPADLLLWERWDQRVGFYWFERGDEKVLYNAIEVLKGLAESIALEAEKPAEPSEEGSEAED